MVQPERYHNNRGRVRTWTELDKNSRVSLLDLICFWSYRLPD